MLELGYLGFHCVKLDEDFQRCLANGDAGGKRGLLVKLSDAQPSQEHDLAPVSFFLAGQKTKEGCFARTVSAHKADALSRIDLKGDPAQHFLSAVRFMNIIEAEKHFWSEARSTRDSRFERASGD